MKRLILIFYLLALIPFGALLSTNFPAALRNYRKILDVFVMEIIILEPLQAVSLPGGFNVKNTVVNTIDFSVVLYREKTVRTAVQLTVNAPLKKDL